MRRGATWRDALLPERAMHSEPAPGRFEATLTTLCGRLRIFLERRASRPDVSFRRHVMASLALSPRTQPCATATWASASNRRKTVAGSPGCQMSAGRKLSRTPTVDIAMNPRDLWITQRLRLRARKISSRSEPLSFSSPTSRRSRFFRRKVAPRPSTRGMSARLCRQTGGTITQGSRAWRTLAASCSESKGFGRKNIPGSHRSPG